MGIIATVKQNGMSGKLYLTVITAYDQKNNIEIIGDNTVVKNPVTVFLLRGFESREVLQKAINQEIQEDIIGYEKEFTIPLVDLSIATRPQIYEWLKSNVFHDAEDCFL